MRNPAPIFFAGTLLAVSTALVAHGCGSIGDFIPCTVGPDSPRSCEKDRGLGPGYVCVCFEDDTRPYPDCEGECVRKDEVDGGHSAVADPCSDGPCVPRSPQDWSAPQWLWVGPSDAYPDRCPEQAPETVYQGVANPVGEPALCDWCDCSAPAGTCDTLPETIELRSTVCGLPGEVLPFDGPKGWDGSCTQENAIQAGAECPPGSGVPCARAVSVGPLGAPIETDCAPFNVPRPEPHVSLNDPQWTTKARVCAAPMCEDKGEACLSTRAPLPEGYRQCVSRPGVHECPSPYDAARFVTYDLPKDGDNGMIDTRGCSECTCSLPYGGLCSARFEAYQDSKCSKVVAQMYPIISDSSSCFSFMQPGTAVGSKTITDLTYLPGACQSFGGEPIGTVEPRPGHEMTLCCIGEI
jgi:hypothetical protein